MGYYVAIESSTFHLPTENQQEAYDRMCKLNFDNSKKRGGRFPCPENLTNDQHHDKVWYSWMSWNYHETCKNATDILNHLGFEVYEDENNLMIVSYDSKTGSEDLFLETIADLCHGEIEWSGEDGKRWKDVFNLGKSMKTMQGKVVYE
jgi:hypothetical protein